MINSVGKELLVRCCGSLSLQGEMRLETASAAVLPRMKFCSALGSFAKFAIKSTWSLLNGFDYRLGYGENVEASISRLVVVAGKEECY